MHREIAAGRRAADGCSLNSGYILCTLAVVQVVVAPEKQARLVSACSSSSLDRPQAMAHMAHGTRHHTHKLALILIM